MKQTSLGIKAVGVILALFLVTIFILFVIGKVQPKTFWMSVIPLAFYAFWYLPKMNKK